MTYIRSTLSGYARLKSEGLKHREIYACITGNRYFIDARFRMMYARWNLKNKNSRPIPVEIYDPTDECWWDC